MPVRFQQRCVKCRKNFVQMYSSRQFPICAPCQLAEISRPIKSKAMAAFFDIPQEFYEQSQFLRSIKSSYLRFENITPAQREAFVKVVEEMKHPEQKQKK